MAVIRTPVEGYSGPGVAGLHFVDGQAETDDERRDRLRPPARVRHRGHRAQAQGPGEDRDAEGVARCPVSTRPQLTRNREGVEVTSTTQIITAPGLDCPAESRLTLPSGRITRAISVANHTAPGLPVPQSTEVMCE